MTDEDIPIIYGAEQATRTGWLIHAMGALTTSPGYIPL